MSNSTIRAALDNGPRVGEVLEIEPGEDGMPPTSLVVSDPLGEDATESTTYHLQQEGAEPGTYVYRAGNSSDEADEPDEASGSEGPDEASGSEGP